MMQGVMGCLRTGLYQVGSAANGRTGLLLAGVAVPAFVLSQFGFTDDPDTSITASAGAATPSRSLANVAWPTKTEGDSTAVFGEPANLSEFRKAATGEPQASALIANATPFFFSGDKTDKQRALDCLSAVAWYEAGDNYDQQRSVVQVVLNRVRHPSFPNSVCGVVFQGSQRRTGCQFTFTCDGSFSRRPSPGAWKRARGVAQTALDGGVDESVHQATHYHANYVTPWWSSKLVKLSTVGAHIFYRWPGTRGMLPKSGKTTGEFNVRHLASLGVAHNEHNELESVATEAQISEALSVKALVADSDLEATSLPASRPSGPILIDLAEGSVPGRWALTAMKRCMAGTRCHVVAYAQEQDANDDTAGDDALRPAFILLRDQSSQMTIALWDCRRFPRQNAAECLPAQGSALDRLVKGRSILAERPKRVASQFVKPVSERP